MAFGMTRPDPWRVSFRKPLSPFSDGMWLLSALFAAANLSQAQVLSNGGFETGTLAPWNVTGVARVETASFGVQPVEGRRQAFLNSNSPVFATDLERALFESSNGQLSGLGNGIAYQGSVITQTTTVAAGQSVRFSYDFLTNEDPGDPIHANDFAFVTLGDTILTLASVEDPPKGLTLAPASTGFTSHTGYVSFNFDVAPGTYTLGFGIVDVDDGATPSGLLVDNVAVVPEPWIRSMWIAAGLLLAGAGRQIRRR